jgi:hypothetical protein
LAFAPLRKICGKERARFWKSGPRNFAGSSVGAPR